MHVALLALTFFPGIALAHTRWFAPPGVEPYSSQEPTGLYIAVLAFLAASTVLLAAYAERRGILRLDFLRPRRDHAFVRASATFSMIAGAFFLIAGTHEYLFSPNLTVESGVPYLFIVLQILVGAAFLFGAFARLAAAGLALLWLGAFFFVQPLMLFENAWVFSTALFILIMGSDYFSVVPYKILANVTRPLEDYALPFLRIGTGVTLLVLGFSEKLLNPEFGVSFLSAHEWNFMQLLGFEWYTDYLFTLSAGAVEALIGLIFILGIATRVNALVLAIFFTIPMFILGPVELSGHLPHFAAVILLILFGGGERLKIVSPRHLRHLHRTV